MDAILSFCRVIILQRHTQKEPPMNTFIQQLQNGKVIMGAVTDLFTITIESKNTFFCHSKHRTNTIGKEGGLKMQMSSLT